MTSSSKAAIARDAILSQKEYITRITGEIESEDVDRLEEEIGGAATTVKSNHYTNGRTNGHLAAILSKVDYRTVLGDAAWDQDPPTEQEAYDPAAAANANAAHRAQQEAQWRRKDDDLDTDTGVQEGAKELIVYAAGEDALSALKKRFIGFGGTTPRLMIKHLRDKTCIRMTTSEKDRFKRDGYAKPWDVTKNITSYFKNLDDLTIKLNSRNIATSEEEKIMAAVARMWDSGFFTEEKLIEWEGKDAALKTWANVQSFFGKLYHDHKQFSKATAKKAQFADHVNNVNEKREAAAEADDATMMLAIMQEQHQEQLNAMRESNKAAMEMATAAMAQMTKQMSTICAANAVRETTADEDKENVPPGFAALKRKEKRQQQRGQKAIPPGEKQPKLCPNCKRVVYHKPECCLELEENKKWRRGHWKSVL